LVVNNNITQADKPLIIGNKAVDKFERISLISIMVIPFNVGHLYKFVKFPIKIALNATKIKPGIKITYPLNTLLYMP